MSSRRGDDHLVIVRIPEAHLATGCTVIGFGVSGPIDIVVPPGLSEGERWIIEPGAGKPGENGGPAGDLVGEIELIREPIRGDDIVLVYEARVSSLRAGGKGSLPGPTGRVDFDVPPNTRDGGRWVALKGGGHRGFNGGEPGDIIIIAKALPNPVRGDDEVMILDVPASVLANGGTVKAMGLTGIVEVNVPAGTADKSRWMAVKGGGHPGSHGGEPGDLVVLARSVADPVPVAANPAAPAQTVVTVEVVEGASGIAQVSGQMFSIPADVPNGTHYVLHRGADGKPDIVALVRRVPAPRRGSDAEVSVALPGPKEPRQVIVSGPRGRVAVDLPAGATVGTRFVAQSGGGHPGVNGGEPGDLLVQLTPPLAIEKSAGSRGWLVAVVAILLLIGGAAAVSRFGASAATRPAVAQVSVKICATSGGLATPFCPETKTKSFARGQEPAKCQEHTKPLVEVEICVTSSDRANPDCPKTEMRKVPKGEEPARCTLHRPAVKPVLVRICIESGGRANAQCSNTETREFDPGEVPGTCRLHRRAPRANRTGNRPAASGQKRCPVCNRRYGAQFNFCPNHDEAVRLVPVR